ncbi:hypothetical protein SJX93_32155 [Streptomyces cyaneofuscatus]|uniref:hypothetical protein n=1 Tax=Streptomyces cyaneofuscatus TaxID=66883 RepID=UPI002D772F6B|nr:hypothetical protein [Streptomyces cyaneofuscatus]WRO13988.1 hypothetical protein SJX93_32155 [Streptomyces cyaneofuscatus]
MVLKRVRPMVAAVLVMASAGVLSSATGASATSADFEYEVTRKAVAYVDIPETAMVFTAAAGEKSYLWSRNLTVANVTPLGSGDNIGTTAAVRCGYSHGGALPAEAEAGSYWAANQVPPGEASVSPALRWVFVAPTAGTYTCRLSVVSYSSIIQNGRTVTMKVPAGAELDRAVYANAARWTLPAGSATVIARGTTQTTLGYTYVPTGGDNITLVQDAALTTCVPNSAICGGGSTAYDGTKAETWIEVQPQNADGTKCGDPISGPVAKWSISSAKHHRTATNAFHLIRSQLRGCTHIRATLKVKNTDGNPVNLHAGRASGQIAATHGLGFTY